MVGRGCPEHPREVSLQIEQMTALGQFLDHDLLHQDLHDVDRLLDQLGVRDRDFEIAHPLGIEPIEIRGQLRLGKIYPRQSFDELGLLFLGFLEFGKECRAIETTQDCGGRVSDLLLQLLQATLESLLLRTDALHAFPECGRIVLPEDFESGGLHEVFLQSGKDYGLGINLAEPGHSDTTTRPLLLRCLAVVVAAVAGSGDRQFPATALAEQQSRQKKLRAAGCGARSCALLFLSIDGVGSQAFLAPLDPIPESFVDAPEVRDVAVDPLLLRAQAGYPRLCGRMKAIFKPVPDANADVELVVQDARSSLDVPQDRVLEPGTTRGLGTPSRFRSCAI